MLLTDLPRLVDSLPGFDSLIKRLSAESAREAVEIEGLAGPAKGFVLGRLYTRLDRPVLLITYQQEQAQRLADDLLRFGVPPDRLSMLPAAQGLFLEGDMTDHRVIGERIGALLLLASGKPCVVIATIEALLQRTAPPSELTPYVFTLHAGQEVDYDSVIARLAAMGYTAAGTVTRPGEFSRRGGILDVYPSIAEAPVRLELFGDELESIRVFDVSTQRSIGRQAEVELTPAREIRLSQEAVGPAVAKIRADFAARLAELAQAGTREARESMDRLTDRVENELAQIEAGAYFDGLEQYLPYLVPDTICAADYLSPHGVVILNEPNQVKDHWERLSEDMQTARSGGGGEGRPSR